MDRAADRVKVIIHTGAGSTDAALRLSRHARDIGANAISSVPPIYFKYTTEEIIDYYRDLIKASEMPRWSTTSLPSPAST